MGEAGVIWSRLTSAFLMNCQLFGLTLLFALPLGLLASLGSMSRFTPLRGVVKTFVWIIRGTPLMLQIIVIYLGPGLMGFASPWGSSTNGRLLAAVVAFVINYACYFSEIYRGGIESVPVGQTEAGQVLGMTKTQIFFKSGIVSGRGAFAFQYMEQRQDDEPSCLFPAACPPHQAEPDPDRNRHSTPYAGLHLGGMAGSSGLRGSL